MRLLTEECLARNNTISNNYLISYAMDVLLPHFENKMRLKVADKLRDQSTLPIVIDFWSSRLAQGYVALSTYIVEEAAVQPLLIHFSPFKKRQTAANIKEELKIIFDKLNITSKVCYIVTDNAANLRKASSNK